MTTRTPVRDTEHKYDIIDHINEDHSDDVLNIALTYADPHAQSARVADLYEEGLLMETHSAQGCREYFIPFQLDPCSLDEQIHYIVFRAAVEQGKPLTGGKNQYFTVISNEKITPNMQRITLKSEQPVPENEPGYAWYFQLQTHNRRTAPQAGRLPSEDVAAQRQLMEKMRHADSRERQQVLGALFEGLRYYTLRATRKSPDAAFADIAVIDVFLHGNTHGSRWASTLQAGDLIRSTADFHEHTTHLAQGRALLMGDETALPTVAALLENWQNPIPPVVISITGDEADQPYLPDTMLPAGTHIHRISSRGDTPAAITACLKLHPEIDTAWGALEAADATAIRKYLRELGLPRERNRIKGYWRRAAAPTDKAV